MVAWLVTVLGVALVLVVLSDIYRTLWQPSGQGPLTRVVMVSTWRLAGVRGPRRRHEGAGPMGMVLVVLAWGGLMVLGWALVYLPHLPGSFAYVTSLDPSPRSPAVDALYVSMVTLGTLGFGDVVPTETWLRVVVPLQGLMGFALLTAAVSWVLQVYPALARRRVLALRLSMLRRAQQDDPAFGVESAAGADLLGDLAAALAHVRVDLSQNPESYYHREADGEAALSRMLGFAARLADGASCSSREDVRLGGSVLRESISDLCGVLADRFGHAAADEREVLERYARDQGHDLLP